MFFNKDPNRQYQNDIKKYDDKTLLSEFRSENYAKLGTEKRVALVQEVENREAAIQGRPALDVINEPEIGNYGSYHFGHDGKTLDFKDTVICVDVNQNPYEVLDTYYHEGSRHALQEYSIRTGKGNIDQDTALQCRAERGRITSDTYSLSTREIDANTGATQKMLEHKELFQDDYKYYSYLKDREAHYDSVIAKNDSNPNLRSDEMSRKADEAARTGTITEKERDRIQGQASPNDKYIQDCHRMRNEVKQGIEQSNEAISKKQQERIPDKVKADTSPITKIDKADEVAKMMRSGTGLPSGDTSAKVADIMRNNDTTGNGGGQGSGQGQNSKPD